MAIFRLAEVFGRRSDDMAKARKIKADDAKVSAWVSRFAAARADRTVFEATLAEIEENSALTSADLIAIAHSYNKGGKKPTSRAMALALIRKRFVEIARFHAKNKVAERVRPW